MSTDWVFVGFPIDSLDETHVYVEQGEDVFVKRCTKEHSVTGDSIVQVSEDEMRRLLADDESTFCAECVRYLSGVAMA